MSWLHLRNMAFGREKRAAGESGYTEQRVAQSIAAATGQTGDIHATAAAEIAAGQWSRAFASAQLKPDNPAFDPIGPEVLGMIGRQLIACGEFVAEVLVVDTQNGPAIRLMPAAWWDVQGGPSPDSWRYLCTFSGADRETTRLLPAERVVHVRYGASPDQPWRGVSPLARMSSTSALVGTLERRLGEEVSGQVGSLLPVPSLNNTDALRADLANMRGRLSLVETQAGSWSDGAGAPVGTRDWMPVRIGANPPETLAMLRSESALSVLAACGVPVELIATRGDGTAQREAWRRFLFGTVAPVGSIVERELRDKLDAPDLKLDWNELRASDLAGRARAFQSLVGAGMKVAKAAALSGLVVE